MNPLNNLVKLTLKNKIITSVTMITIFSAGVIYFLIYPAIVDIQKIGQDIENQRIDLEKRYVRGQSLNKLSRDLKNIEPSLAVLDDVFIDQNRALEFVTTLEDVAGKSGVSQKINLMTDKSTKEFDYMKTPLQIAVQGDFASILRYITGLESLNYYININTIDIARNSGDNNSPASKNVAVQITADTFWK